MPCILKQSLPGSPGIITFTHGEALWGLPKRSRRVREFLTKATMDGKWLFGIHVQGDCSHLTDWPMPEWQSFVMWPTADASFLHNLPPEQFCPYTCVNFMPGALAAQEDETKQWDICVVSRASSIKKIKETLLLLRNLLDKRPDTKIVMVVPDPRHQALGNTTYAKQRIDESYFTLPKSLFSARELKNISFISSSQDSFGNFPLSDSLIADLLAKSKFMMLASHLEGVPRVIAEALLLGTPCIVSEHLRSGLNAYLNDSNTLRISDDPHAGADQVDAALASYERFTVDRRQAKEAFSESEYLAPFKTYLSQKIVSAGHQVQGRWYLEDMHLRLACHGQKQHLQFFYREELFFQWLERAAILPGEYADEDFLAAGKEMRDTPSLLQKARQRLGPIAYRLKKIIR